MNKEKSKKLTKQLEAALVLEERAIMDFQYNCYGQLPGDLNQKEFEEIKSMLDLIMVQSLNHANIVGDLIIKFYEKTSKKL